MAAAGGIRSSVNDLLKLYAAFMGAAREEMEWDSMPRNKTSFIPIAYALDLMQSYVGLPGRALHERSYGLGWARTQLPSTFSLGYTEPSKTNPVVGVGALPRLALYHTGLLPGFASFAAMFPETDSAVVVLTNSLARSDGSRWIAELLIEALFENQYNAHNYGRVAMEQTEHWRWKFKNMKQDFAANATATKAELPLGAYVGRYWNRLRNFFLDIVHEAGSDSLQVSFMGRETDTFELTPYKNGSFYWTLSQDESARRARMTTYFDQDHYVLKFKPMDAGNQVTGLWWRHDVNIQEPGELFKRDWMV